jgi:hypothetical protein
VVAEAFEFGDFLGDEAERGLDIAARHVDVAAEASDSLDLQRVVEFPILFERGALGFGEGVEDQIADGFGGQWDIVERVDGTVDPHASRSPGAEMEIGTAAGDGFSQVFGDVAGHGADGLSGNSAGDAIKFLWFSASGGRSSTPVSLAPAWIACPTSSAAASPPDAREKRVDDQSLVTVPGRIDDELDQAVLEACDFFQDSAGADGASGTSRLAPLIIRQNSFLVTRWTGPSPASGSVICLVFDGHALPGHDAQVFVALFPDLSLFQMHSSL